MSLSAWRAALRIARRDALRAKGRSALIIAMIALPVVGVTGADIVARSSQLTPQERSTRLMGTADAYVSTGRQPGWRLVQAPDPDPRTTTVLSQSGPKPTPTPEEEARAALPLERLLKQALPAEARLLPVEATVVSHLTSTSYGQGQTQTWGLDLADPLARGITTLRQGSWPAAPYEIAASTGFLTDSGLKVGQDTTLKGTTQPLRITAEVEYPGDLKVSRLTGRPGELSGLLAALPEESTSPTAPGARDYLLALPGHAAFSWEAVQNANAYGFTVASRAVLADPPPATAVSSSTRAEDDRTAFNKRTIAVTVVGMALLEIVLLAGPAFAVGARRSRRQLGLLAACGGNRAHVRRVVLGGGIVLGTAGAAAGAVLGGLAVLAGRSWLEARSGVRFGHFALEPADLLGIMTIGLVTGLLAAIVPAVQAARQPVLAALTGRVTARPPARWLAFAGAGLILTGVAVALLGRVESTGSRSVLAGSVLAELGLIACTPLLVSLFGRLGRFLPLSSRLALRDSARHRGRTAPAVAAVMAAVAGAVAVLTFQSSSDSASRSSYSASAPTGAVVLRAYPVSEGGHVSAPASAKNATDLRTAIERTVPDLGRRADLAVLGYGACDGAPGSFCGNARLLIQGNCPDLSGPGAIDLGVQRAAAANPACATLLREPDDIRELISGDATVLHNLLGVDSPAATQALDQGRVLVQDPRYLVDGKVVLQLTRYGATGPDGNQLSTVSLPGTLVQGEVQGARAVLSPTAAQAAGLLPSSTESVWRPARTLASAEEQRTKAAVVQTGDHGKLSVERGYQAGSANAVVLGLAIAAAAVAIAAAAIATGLAATDTQGDLATLAAVGAPPGVRRRLSGFQCAVVAGMGAVTGVLAGLVPAAAIQRVLNLGFTGGAGSSGSLQVATAGPLVIPWAFLAALAVGLPLLSWLLAAGFTRSRVPLARRTE
ncbi:FtsX-like permease family protein [Kitasatospora sp. NPDC002040]|uniref:FtsX-like permease family protein n=1 Tax=Kitasatospora sp. NPDC002040 TaxID=3154661 RepID=UPI00332CB099